MSEVSPRTRRDFLRWGAGLAAGLFLPQLIRSDSYPNKDQNYPHIPIKSEVPIPSETQILVDGLYAQYTSFTPHVKPLIVFGETQIAPPEGVPFIPNAHWANDMSTIIFDPAFVTDPKWSQLFELVLRHELAHAFPNEFIATSDNTLENTAPELHDLEHASMLLSPDPAQYEDVCIRMVNQLPSFFDESSYMDPAHVLLLDPTQQDRSNNSGSVSVTLPTMCYPGHPGHGAGELFASGLNVFTKFPKQFQNAVNTLTGQARVDIVFAKDSILDLVERLARNQFGNNAERNIRQIVPKFEELKKFK